MPVTDGAVWGLSPWLNEYLAERFAHEYEGWKLASAAFNMQATVADEFTWTDMLSKRFDYDALQTLGLLTIWRLNSAWLSVYNPTNSNLPVLGCGNYSKSHFLAERFGTDDVGSQWGAATCGGSVLVPPLPLNLCFLTVAIPRGSSKALRNGFMDVVVALADMGDDTTAFPDIWARLLSQCPIDDSWFKTWGLAAPNPVPAPGGAQHGLLKDGFAL